MSMLNEEPRTDADGEAAASDAICRPLHSRIIVYILEFLIYIMAAVMGNRRRSRRARVTTPTFPTRIPIPLTKASTRPQHQINHHNHEEKMIGNAHEINAIYSIMIGY